MSLYGYKRKTRPAPWTTTPAEARMRKDVARRHAEEKADRRADKLWARRRNRIAPVSDRRRGAMAEYRREARLFVAAAVALGETCPVADSVEVLKERKVDNRLTEVHHVRGRSGTLLMDKRFWMAVSSAGHAWIHQEAPTAAAERGWLAGPGEWGDSDKSSERKTQIDIAKASGLGYCQDVNR